jgi:NADPH:quinone reductase
MIPSMRAVVVTRFGGPEVLELRDEPDPEAGPDDLLVAPEAIGVNYRDIYEREGRYGGETPLVAGAEGAGTVVAGASQGDRVAWVSAPGSYPDRVVLAAERAVPIPDAVSTETAAAVLLQGATAHYLTTSVYPVQAGDDVLVHAAAGGVGLLLTQLATKLGARVIATTSGGEKAQLAREAGADEVIGYEGFGERARELTGGRGVAVVYDGVGRDTFDDSLVATRVRGTVVLFGAASGPVPPFDPMRLERAGSLFLTRPALRNYTSEREELLARAADVFAWVADGSLNVRKTTGKLLLVP